MDLRSIIVIRNTPHVYHKPGIRRLFYILVLQTQILTDHRARVHRYMEVVPLGTDTHKSNGLTNQHG